MPQPRKHADHAARQAAYRARQSQAHQEQLKQRGLPPLPAVASIPGQPRWNAALQAARCMLSQVCEEMDAYYGDRSDTWQESERGESFSERQEAVASLVTELELLIL